MIAKLTGYFLSTIHSLLFLVLLLNCYPPNDGQTMWGWMIFFIIDFIPSITAYFLLEPWYYNWLNSLNQSWFKEIITPQYWLYGPICAIWWYYFPRLFMPKKWGGIWGIKPKDNIL
jgi:hypothetical protein